MNAPGKRTSRTAAGRVAANPKALNRRLADYAELLLTKHIAMSRGVTFAHETETSELAKLVHALDRSRAERQERNVEQLAEPVMALLGTRVAELGPVTEVLWKGRTSAGRDVTDILVVHASGRTRLSLKSTAGGEGTARNVGLKRLRIDAGAIYAEMQRHARSVLDEIVGDDARRSRLAKVAWSRLRHELTGAERDVVKERVQALPYQQLLALEIAETFSGHDHQERLTLARYLLGGGEDPSDLFIASANDNGAAVHPIRLVGAEDRIEYRLAEGDEPVAVDLYVNGVRTLNLQVGCTNGIGLSQFCVRAFAVG